MALANVAALLSKAGRSVLVVDWDLEAPGLHKFFESSSPSLRKRMEDAIGILELLGDVRRDGSIPWRNATIGVPLGSSSIDIIPAGRRDAQYGPRLQELNWARLYDEHDVGQAFENMREEWKSCYDFVLLDSRTGVTDIGDACTALFPDLLVTVFVANEQNLEGTKLIVERARKVHGQLPRDRSKLIIVPLLGRDESFTEYELSTTWRKRIGAELGFTLTDWLPKDLTAESYFQKIFIPYYSYWSFGENLPVIQQEQELEKPTSISAAYARITSLIDSGLDWGVLERGVDSAEINSLRSRAAEGEANTVELEHTRQQLETAVMQAERLRRTQWLRTSFSIMGVVMFFTLTVVAFLFYQTRLLATKTQVAAATELESTRVALDTANRQIEEQRNQLNGQIAALQGQNANLLEQLRHQYTDTQQKLDTIINQSKVPGISLPTSPLRAPMPSPPLLPKP